MKKLLIAPVLACLVLAGCQKTKDAEYYYDHPEELKTLLSACSAKLEAAPDEAVAALRDDQECRAATVANLGIEYKDIKKALLKQEDIWASRVEGELFKRAHKNDEWETYMLSEYSVHPESPCLDDYLCVAQKEITYLKAEEGIKHYHMLSEKEFEVKNTDYCKPSSEKRNQLMCDMVVSKAWSLRYEDKQRNLKEEACLENPNRPFLDCEQILKAREERMKQDSNQ